VAIIGAGLGGLSAALVLSHHGYDVTVFERNEGPGGKAGNLVLEGYRFDTGPSLLTMPSIFDRLFAEVGEDREDHLRFVRLDPITRYFFPDGTRVNAYADPGRFASEMEAKLDIPSQRVSAYLERCRRIYEMAGDLFLLNDLREGAFSMEALKGALNFWRLDLFRTMHDTNERRLMEKRAVQLFDRYATYNGSDPYRLSGIFNMIQHVEYNMGSYAVKGGIFEIPRRIHGLSEERGAVFRFGEEVDRVLHENGRVRGISVNGREERFDAVVSNSDVVHTYGTLLRDEGARIARRYRTLEPSVSGSVHYIGMAKGSDDLLVNNIFFSSDYRREFEEIFREGRCPTDPTVYVNITSKVDPEDAPAGGENWFVLINVPWDSGQDWPSETERTFRMTMDRVGSALGRDLEGYVAVKGHLDPSIIRERYLTNKGSIYGISSNGMYSAFLRQRARSERYGGLYFAGGSAHPGGGMPLVVSSGMIASRALMRYQ